MSTKAAAVRSVATQEDGTILREIATKTRQVSDKERTLEFVLTTLHVNRYGEVDKPDGGRFAEYKLNPVVLFCHNSHDLPVAKTLELSPSPTELLGLARFAGMEQKHPFADTVYCMYRDGFLNATSIGFRPITVSEDKIMEGQTGITILEWELIEWSCVPVPANPYALKRFIRAYGLPPGATERDLTQAVRLDSKRWFTAARAWTPVHQPAEAIVTELQRIGDPKDRLAVMERMQAAVKAGHKRPVFVGRAGCIDKVNRFFFQCEPPPGKTQAGMVSMTRDDVRAIVEELRAAEPDLFGPVAGETEERMAQLAAQVAEVVAGKQRQVLSDEALEKLRTAHDLIGMVIAEEESGPPADGQTEEEDEGGEEKPGDEKKPEEKKPIPPKPPGAKGDDEEEDEEEERMAAYMDGVFRRLMPVPATT